MFTLHFASYLGVLFHVAEICPNSQHGTGIKKTKKAHSTTESPNILCGFSFPNFDIILPGRCTYVLNMVEEEFVVSICCNMYCSLKNSM